jgi:[acyl-carrier-protein] S-malonyltransferase
MGQELAEAYPGSIDLAQADDVLVFALSRLCFEGPEAELMDTVNAQPAILTHSIATLRVVEQVAPGSTRLWPATAWASSARWSPPERCRLKMP